MDGRRWSGVLAWAGAGVAFAAYPAVRPAGDSGADWATTAWLVGHLVAVAGFGLLVAGLGALWSAVRDGPGERYGFAAVATGGVGAVLVLPYYGAEVFALHAIGVAGGPVSLGDGIRYLPAAATTFATGLVALAVASVLAAVAVRRSRTLPAWTGWLLAAGWVLYLPQFFAPYGLRVAHGVLVAAGCLAVAWSLRRARGAGLARPSNLLGQRSDGRDPSRDRPRRRVPGDRNVPVDPGWRSGGAVRRPGRPDRAARSGVAVGRHVLPVVGACRPLERHAEAVGRA